MFSAGSNIDPDVWVVAVSVVGVVGVAVWVAAMVVATAVLEGEAMVVTSTLGWVMVTTSLSRADSVGS
jgi:hypothetical protein